MVQRVLQAVQWTKTGYTLQGRYTWYSGYCKLFNGPRRVIRYRGGTHGTAGTASCSMDQDGVYGTGEVHMVQRVLQAVQWTKTGDTLQGRYTWYSGYCKLFNGPRRVIRYRGGTHGTAGTASCSMDQDG